MRHMQRDGWVAGIARDGGRTNNTAGGPPRGGRVPSIGFGDPAAGLLITPLPIGVARPEVGVTRSPGSETPVIWTGLHLWTAGSAVLDGVQPPSSTRRLVGPERCDAVTPQSGISNRPAFLSHSRTGKHGVRADQVVVPLASPDILGRNLVPFFVRVYFGWGRSCLWRCSRKHRQTEGCWDDQTHLSFFPWGARRRCGGMAITRALGRRKSARSCPGTSSANPLKCFIGPTVAVVSLRRCWRRSARKGGSGKIRKVDTGTPILIEDG